MQQIVPANERILQILRKARPVTNGVRLIKYCLPLEIDDGILLYNLLTREMVLLTKSEYENRLESQYLRDHWFVIPVELDEKEFYSLVYMFFSGMHKKKKNIIGYTILTTTDCNARCFYCYELGRKRINMSEETALKTAEYIKNHCGDDNVHITWFGGEPLFNLNVIDIISNYLSANDIPFDCRVISNGYLFDQDTVNKAVSSWNMKSVQISLDGTEDVYNKAKAFIYKGGSAYHIVLQNISRLLEAGVRVQIRLNMDLNNAHSLMKLVDELADYFPNKSNLPIYPHLIFDDKCPAPERYSPEELTQLYDLFWALQQRIASRGFSFPNHQKLRKSFRLHCCMADSDNCKIILPNGHIGVCEHHTEDELIGHIDTDTFDQSVIASWKKRRQEIPECEDCFYYPDCAVLEKCPSNDMCFKQIREYNQKCIERAMLQEYLRWRDHPEEDISGN